MRRFFFLCAAFLFFFLSMGRSNCYASSKILLEMEEMMLYRPSLEEMYENAATAKAIFTEAFSTTYREYHRQSGSIESIEEWLRLKEGASLESWLSNVFEEEYEEYLSGSKAFLYLRHADGTLIGWLSHSPVSEKGDLYLSQCSLEAGSRNRKAATRLLAQAFQGNFIKQLFPEVKEIKLIARKINTIAHHLYTKAGFIRDETIDPSIYGDSYDDRYVGFRLVLAEEEITDILSEIISPDPFVISAHQVEEITRRCHLTVEELLRMLVPLARSYARPPISNYQVGAAALGKSGSIYLGVNLEFLGIPLNEAIHAEQFAITHARSHGETELTAIALSAAPCGHCRQFLNEMAGGENLQLLILDSAAISLSSLLPDSFGPKDLGLSGNLLTPLKSEFPCFNEDSPLIMKAWEAACASYIPYTASHSGVAMRLKDGTIYCGCYLENAAFNPSISPLQAALILLVADRREYHEVSEVVLVEKQSAKVSQEIMSRAILKNIAPQAVFHAKKLPFSQTSIECQK